MTKQEAIKEAEGWLKKANAPAYYDDTLFNPTLEQRDRYAMTGLGYATLALSLKDDK